MRFLNFINEEQFKGKYYYPAPKEITNDIKRHLYTSIYDENDYEYKSGEYFAFNKNILKRYVRNIGSFSAVTSTFNYIYEIENVNILNCKDERDIKKAISLKALGREFTWEKWKSSNDNDKVELIKNNLIGKGFLDNYDGITSILKDEILIFIYDAFDISKKLKLVDGNEIRFSNSSDVEFEFPEDVKNELLRYTNNAKKKINSQIKLWLKEHSPKSNKAKKIYRAVGIQFDDYGDWSNVTVNSVEKLLSKYFGIKRLKDIKLKSEAKLKRGKESSWSTIPVIAREFASSMAEKSINILVEAVVPANDIIVDFTELPINAQKDFKYKNQNEVIVDTGTIQSKIIGVWADKDFIKWLNENNYNFKANTGIF